MSLARFQTCVARLITDPDFRDRIRSNDPAALADELTALESTRLCRIAADRGLDINRTLHKGFRLGKLRAMLPLTCEALGPRRLTKEVAAFWAQRPPTSFYFISEALEFCDFLATRGLRGVYLDEIIAYERAVLALEQPGADRPIQQTVRFRHEPSLLLTCLAAGGRPRSIPHRNCTAFGIRGEDGRAHWRLVDGDSLPRVEP